MADNSDILQQLQINQATQEETMKQINLSLQQIAANLPSLAEYENRRDDYRDPYNRRDPRQSIEDDDRWKVNREHPTRGKGRRTASQQFDDFTDELFKQFSQQIFGDTIADMVKGSLSNLADSIGVDLGSNLGETAGKLLGNQIGKWFKGTDLGGGISNAIQSAKGNVAGSLNNLFDSLAGNVNPQAMQQAASAATNATAAVADAALPAAEAAQTAGSALAAVGTEAGASAASLTSLSVAAPGVGIAIALLLVAIDKWTEDVGKSFNETKAAMSELNDALDAAMKRIRNMAKIRLDTGIKRVQADAEAMITASFDVLKDATNDMLQAWTSSLRTITATQGYTKSGMQDLLSDYAKRLQSEGLSSVVSTVDLTKNLTSVLESGLSGPVAEEFAYIATKLEAAIPTENFFQYASTYASIAANAIAAGQSQQEALEYANAELEQFASNLLYSSRELAGGFSTGLKDASGLFKSATEIALASRTGQASQISGVLTAVSAAVGAVAPDLASGIVDAVVSAALGGNSNSAFTALRSLSGAGASNTAFLQALATDSQGLFQTLFANLANLQNMSKDNYMEVAEGLSEIFGVSKEAFARVDFSYLSDMIGAMNIDGESLGKNLSLLISGQTTYTAEQARIAEVNKIMIEDGLAYVLDNEVARTIQQHMWDEQLAQEIEENTFGVNIEGKAFKVLQTIQNLVDDIWKLLNPISSGMQDAGELLETVANNSAMNADIEAMLKATVVGNGRASDLRNLTTTGKDLNLVQSYLSRLGVQSAGSPLANLLANAGSAMWHIATVSQMLPTGFGGGNTTSMEAQQIYDELGIGLSNVLGPLGQAIDSFSSNFSYSSTFGYDYGDSGSRSRSTNSLYNWSMLGKSALANTVASPTRTAPYAALSAQTAQQAMATDSQRKMTDFIATMKSFVDDNKSFNDWQKSASKFGIVDVDQALADFGLSIEDAESEFRHFETSAGIARKQELASIEQEFWETSITWYTETYPNDLESMTDLLLDMHEELMDQLLKSHRQLQDFYDQWVDYYVNHTAYSKETLDAYNVAAVRTAERQEVGDSVLALAEALTSTSIDLKDPAVQTNVLLAKILIITEAIMQQTNDTTTVSLPTALSSLGLGITTEGPTV